MADVTIVTMDYENNTATILVDDGTGSPQTHTVLIAGTHRTAAIKASLMAAQYNLDEPIYLEEEKQYYSPYDRPPTFKYSRYGYGEYWVPGCNGDKRHVESPSALPRPPYRYVSGTPP